MRMSNGMRGLRALACGIGLLAVTCGAAPAFASVPNTSLLEGVLTSAGGAPAADGKYDITVSVYTAKDAQSAHWTSGKISADVAGGRFALAVDFSGAKLDELATAPWMGIAVGSDPELPRQPLHSAIYALYAKSAGALACTGCVSGDQIANGAIAAAKLGFNYAGSSTKGGPALDLACSGCVSVAELKFDGDVDLGGNSLKAANGTFSGDVSAKTVTATSFVGDGSKLTGIKTPAGTCSKAGEVVKGIKADGTLECVAAMDPAALPKDGLNEISNDLISNQFVDTIQGAKGVKIPDNTGADAISSMTFPNIGVSQTFALTVELKNTDLSTVAITVLPPDDKKTGWTLCDPCGDKDAKAFKKTYTKDALPKSGDLAKWIGQNPQGLWSVKVTDTSYCIPQAPGNSTLCDPNGKTDGEIVAWNITIQTLSNQKIAINGDTYATGSQYIDKNVDVKGGLKVANGATIAGTVDVSNSTLAPAVTRENRKYYAVVAVRDPIHCPEGWNVELSKDLRGSNNYVYIHINGGGMVLTDNQGNGYGQEYIYAGFNYGNNGGDKSAVCWKAYDAPAGRPHVSMINYTGSGYQCPEGYDNFTHAQLRGNNNHVYHQSNRWGFYLGYVDTWSTASNPHTEDGGSYYRYWQNSGQFAGACVKVYGTTEDPETANGVYPVFFGMHNNENECPTGWNKSTTQSIGNGNRIYLSTHATGSALGYLYDWSHSNIYRHVHFTPGEVKNVCWKMLPRTGRPSAQVRAPRYTTSCPSGFLTFSRNTIMGWNNHAYWQSGTSGLYFGGLNSWGHNENDAGYSAVTFNDTNIQKFCVLLENVKN
ncbi:MAG: hypothetical protein RIT45_2873 [Pseudomonadota bacterium]